MNNDNGKPAEEKEFGFYCELCKITFKDSHSLLDHKNGKKHLRMEGLTMKVEKSTKESVLNKLLQIKRKPEKPSIKQ